MVAGSAGSTGMVVSGGFITGRHEDSGAGDKGSGGGGIKGGGG